MEDNNQKLTAMKEWVEYWGDLYKDHVEISNMFWVKIEAFMLFPTVGIVAYLFNQIQHINILDFIIVLSTTSAPIIGSLLGYAYILKGHRKILRYIADCQHSGKFIPRPIEIYLLPKKIDIIQSWTPFTLIAFLISISTAIIVKFGYVSFLICFSYFILVGYLTCAFFFSQHIRKIYKEAKFTCNSNRDIKM